MSITEIFTEAILAKTFASITSREYHDWIQKQSPLVTKEIFYPMTSGDRP